MTTDLGTSQVSVQMFAGIVNPTRIGLGIAPRKTILNYATCILEFEGCKDIDSFYNAFKGQIVTLRGNINGKDVTWVGKLAKHERNGGKYYLDGMTCSNLLYTCDGIEAAERNSRLIVHVN